MSVARISGWRLEHIFFFFFGSLGGVLELMKSRFLEWNWNSIACLGGNSSRTCFLEGLLGSKALLESAM